MGILCSLTACQMAPTGPTSEDRTRDSSELRSLEQPTPLEQKLAADPLPTTAAAKEAECRAMAELYSSSLVAEVTWEYAKTTQRASLQELAGAMRGARARAERLGCSAFWEE